MPIRNVVSTLPDQQYVAALEAELAELRKMVEANQQNVSNLNRGRA